MAGNKPEYWGQRLFGEPESETETKKQKREDEEETDETNPQADKDNRPSMSSDGIEDQLRHLQNEMDKLKQAKLYSENSVIQLKQTVNALQTENQDLKDEVKSLKKDMEWVMTSCKISKPAEVFESSQPSKSPKEILMRYNHVMKLRGQEEVEEHFSSMCFEMLTIEPFELTSSEPFKIPEYGHRLEGFFFSGQLEGTDCGNFTATDNDHMYYDFILDVKQSGQGSLKWFLTTDDYHYHRKEKVVDLKTVNYDHSKGVHLATTTASRPRVDSDHVAWKCRRSESMWVVVQRDEGEANVEWCRFYGYLNGHIHD